MTDIFERVKSPFYHFGMLMRLSKIPHDDFKEYLAERLAVVTQDADGVAEEILVVTACHPYYTQELAFVVWNNLKNGREEDVIALSLADIIATHDLDYERLWLNFNKTDRYVMTLVAKDMNPTQDRRLPTSTTTSALLRLTRKGYIIRSDQYDIEDPFFKKWIHVNVL